LRDAVLVPFSHAGSNIKKAGADGRRPPLFLDVFGMSRALLYGAAARDQVIDEHHNGDHEDQVNQRSAEVQQEADQPNCDENASDCVYQAHGFYLLNVVKRSSLTANPSLMSIYPAGKQGKHGRDFYFDEGRFDVRKRPARGGSP
jgi:hypothetical protein